MSLLLAAARARRSWPRAAAALLLAIAGSARADIVVGQVTPLSGPQAVTGRAIRAGVQLYFDSVNAAGGVRGQRLKLVVRDDAQKPEETVRLVKELIAAESPVAMIGTVGTSNLEALAADGVLARSRVPLVGAISGAASVAHAERMFVVKARYRDEVDRLFDNLAHLGVTRVGVVYQDDGLGRDVLAGAADSATRRNVALMARAPYARNTTDTAAAVALMLQAAPQAIFLGATTAAAADFVMRYRQAGGQAMIYGMSIIDPDVLLKKVGPALARGYAFTMVFPAPTDSRLAVTREYTALQGAAKNPDLSTRSLEGFIAAKALVSALRRVPRAEPDAVANALSSSGSFDVGDFPLDFSQKGRTGSHYVDFAAFGEAGRVVK
jgi:ABC-type branched-subunit amino acid transport system substrate-binding protein